MTGRQVVQPYSLDVDGRRRSVVGAGPGDALLDVLRERVGVTAAKDGCVDGTCGACAVLLGGELRLACLTLAVTASGRAVTTAAGLGGGVDAGDGSGGDGPGDLAHAFAAAGAVGCGFCAPGAVIAAQALLGADADPSDAEIRAALAGVACRCGVGGRRLAAVRATAAARSAAGGGS